MAAKAEEIPPPPAAVAGGASEEHPLEEAENREGARLAKRRRTFPATLETLSSPAAEGEELGESERRGFSFSFEARSVTPIETTPKFGSFHCSASDLESGESAMIEKKEVEEDHKAKRRSTSPHCSASDLESGESAMIEKKEVEEDHKAKRRSTSPPALERQSSPAAVADEEESGGSARGGFLFSFDARSVGTVEATPKFGSFRCAAADLGSGKAEAREGGAKEEGGATGGEGKIGI